MSQSSPPLLAHPALFSETPPTSQVDLSSLSPLFLDRSLLFFCFFFFAIALFPFRHVQRFAPDPWILFVTKRHLAKLDA